MLTIVGAALLLAVTATVACTALVLTRAQDDVITLPLDDVGEGGARLVPLSRFGADGEGRTHGIWVVRLEAGAAVALLTVDPHSGCRVEWRADGRFEGVSPILRDPCRGSVYDAAGIRLAGPASRGLDRFPATVDREAGEIVIAISERQGGPPSPAGRDGAAPAGE